MEELRCEDASLVPTLISRLLATTARHFASPVAPTSFPAELLLALHSVFGSRLAAALDIVDRGGVMVYRGENGGRAVAVVTGSRGLRYTLPHTGHFCPCPAWQYMALGRGATACKHLLALRLAEATKRLTVETISDKRVAHLIQEI